VIRTSLQVVANEMIELESRMLDSLWEIRLLYIRVTVCVCAPTDNNDWISLRCPNDSKTYPRQTACY
jgi:hypothetical protein